MRNAITRWYLSFYLHRYFYLALFGIGVIFALSYFVPLLMSIAKSLCVILSVTVLADAMALYFNRNGIEAVRHIPGNRLSNGDENPVHISVQNNYGFPVRIRVIDEIPVQFQKRNFYLPATIPANGHHHLQYTLRPVSRGEYHFGRLLIFVNGPLQMVTRRYALAQETTVPVYPSYVQMNKYQLLAFNDRLNELGVKRVRRVGHSLEFEQIKEYVPGDDYRTINWKATARRNNLMVNTYTDEKSQPLYCVIDMGRSMKMPFEKMTLLDYAINTSLVLSHTALMRYDKAGLITFAHQSDTFLPAAHHSTQLARIMESLYNLNTTFLESNFDRLHAQVRRRIKQRSLLVLFTNFETPYSMERQLPYLKAMARHHLLLVVFFENTEVKNVFTRPASDLQEIYIKTIAGKMLYEKRLVEKQLRQHGIMSLLTAPQQLTVNVINKYLEIKARNIL
ncbi:MAG: DUF58 domain-containing protein [Chitinophagales bacterium]|nr:DUF58 domain-containing protein [Chitinophagales bacterium]